MGGVAEAGRSVEDLLERNTGEAAAAAAGGEDPKRRDGVMELNGVEDVEVGGLEDGSVEGHGGGDGADPEEEEFDVWDDGKRVWLETGG